MPEKLDDADLKRVGEVVAQRRADLGWSKEQAAREAGISSITWKRVEDGLPVQDAKLASVFRSIGLHGFAGERGIVRVANDRSSVEVRTVEELRDVRRRAISLDEEIDLAVRLVARLRVDLSRAEEQLTELTRRAAAERRHVSGPMSDPVDIQDLPAAAKEEPVEPEGVEFND